MEIFLLLVILVVLILLSKNISDVKNQLTRLDNELHEFKSFFRSSLLPGKEKLPEKPNTASENLPVRPSLPSQVASGMADLPAMEKENPKRPEELKLKKQEPVYATQQISQPVPVSNIPKQSWFNKWLQDNPDIEKFIGENLINKIGISVLVLGIAFFVKYAIDQEWINKTGRVSIGLLCGVILIFFANRLKKNYHAFSSVLIGGGIAIFYFTIAFAFHQYHLIGQAAAFGIMVIITAFAVILSILYDRIELGILATVGGFITPFLVSQGDGNWLVLFSYLAILNAGLIVLAYYKRWRVINFIAFFFTQIIYLGWVFSKSGSPGFNYTAVFVFGIIFYVMFLLMNVIHHVIRSSRLKAFDFIILLSVNLCFYGSGIYLINESGMAHFSGLFTASLGIVNLVLAYLFFKKSKADRKFIYLLIGITISFLSMAAPVQLKGHYITLFWSAEMLVLLWLYQKSFISLLKITVLIITGLMLISLFMDWSAVYDSSPLVHPILFNKGWMTGTFSSVCLFLVYRLLRKEADSFYVWGITNKLLRNIYLVSAIILLYATGAFEINDQFMKRIPGTDLQLIYLQLYLTTFIIILLFWLNRFRVGVNPYLPAILPFIALGLYIINIYSTHNTERILLTSGKYKEWFAGSWIGAGFLLLLIWISIRYLRKNQMQLAWLLPQLTWILAVLCVVIFSAEIRNFFIWINYTDAVSFSRLESMFDKAGLTIVWAVSSFIMIWLGMKYSFKPLRITALVLFGITLIKLFLSDIRDIAPGGKILAFILLGVLLLVISFMYQRLKKIIIDDAKEPG